jgi:uncharacterized membrane protein
VALARHGGAAPSTAASHQTSATPTTTAPLVPLNLANCSIQQLPSPPGLSAQMLVADPTGRFQAGPTENGDSNGKPVLWTDGVPTLLNAPKAIVDTPYNVAAVNSRGDVALNTGETAPTAYRYHGGTFTRLPKLSGYSSSIPAAMSPSGDVVGWVQSSGGAFAAVVWPADRPGSVRKLATPHGTVAMATAVDASGNIGGSLGDGVAPFVWSANGQGHTLLVPSGYRGGMVLALTGQWAVGWVSTDYTDNNAVGARWNLSTGKVDVYADQGEAVAADPLGDFIGGTGEPPGYVYRDGTFRLLPGPDNASRTTPLAISADGKTISGTATALTSTSKPPWFNVIWHC